MRRACPLSADFVAEVADESRKLRRRSAGAVAYHSLRWKRWLEATALAPSTRLQRDLTLIPRMGRPAVAAGRRAWPACGGSARWLPAWTRTGHHAARVIASGRAAGCACDVQTASQRAFGHGALARTPR